MILTTLGSLLYIIGCSSLVGDNDDIVAKLPPEIASILFRMLGGRDLYTASKVNRKWSNIIKSDPVLRRRLRAHIKASRVDPLNRKRMESTKKRKLEVTDDPKLENLAVKHNNFAQHPNKRMCFDGSVPKPNCIQRKIQEESTAFEKNRRRKLFRL